MKFHDFFLRLQKLYLETIFKVPIFTVQYLIHGQLMSPITAFQVGGDHVERPDSAGRMFMATFFILGR